MLITVLAWTQGIPRYTVQRCIAYSEIEVVWHSQHTVAAAVHFLTLYAWAYVVLFPGWHGSSGNNISYWPIAGWNKQHCLLLPQKRNIKPTKSTSLNVPLAHYQVLPLLYCKTRKLYGTFVVRFKDYHTPFLVHVKYNGAKSSVDSGALWPHSLVKCHTAACKPWWEAYFPICTLVLAS